MKFLAPLLLFASTVFAQGKGFVIEGNIKGLPTNKYIYLTHKFDDVTHVDSAKVIADKFAFKGKTIEPNMYWITTNKNDNPTLVFFVDNTKISITGSVDSITAVVVKGGSTQNDYKASLEILNKYAETRKNLIEQHNAFAQAGNNDAAKKIQDTAFKLERIYVQNLEKFIKTHPSSVSGYLIWVVTFDWPQISEYDQLYAALSEPIKKGKFGKLALDKINSMKGTTVGYPAYDFSMNDLDGKKVALSSFKGKYVLIDFWASWCGPCRAENPSVVAAYQKYKDKGFTVFGVSLDSDKNKWQAAIQKDNLTWTHVSDLKGWQNEAAKKYNVTSIPFNLLLDKEGKILAKGLRGQALESKLAEIFGE